MSGKPQKPSYFLPPRGRIVNAHHPSWIFVWVLRELRSSYLVNALPGRCLPGPCDSLDAFSSAFFFLWGREWVGILLPLCFCSFSDLFLMPVCRLFPHQHSILQLFRCQIVSKKSKKFLNLSELVSELTQHCPSEHMPVTRPRPPASDQKLPRSLLMLDYLLE